jgi:hypothetical protein
MAGRETPAGTRIRAASASLCLTDAAPPAGLESVFGRPEAVHALRRPSRDAIIRLVGAVLAEQNALDNVLSMPRSN